MHTYLRERHLPRLLVKARELAEQSLRTPDGYALNPLAVEALETLEALPPEPTAGSDAVLMLASRLVRDATSEVVGPMVQTSTFLDYAMHAAGFRLYPAPTTEIRSAVQSAAIAARREADRVGWGALREESGNGR
jgi:hypothetical protein